MIDQEKMLKAAAIIRENKLQDGAAMNVVDEVVGKPDFARLMQDKINCVCGRELPVSMYPIVNTGVVDVVYNVCPECKQDASELAHLVCIKCRMAVGHIYPHKEPSGFEFVRGKFYHIPTCPGCSNKEKGKADIVEKVLFFKLNNIPIKSDPEYS